MATTEHFTVTVAVNAHGPFSTYNVTVIRPNGLPTSAQRDSLAECWTLAEREMLSWERERAMREQEA